MDGTSDTDNDGILSIVNQEDPVVEEDSLPFIRIKPPPEEEELETIRTVLAWVVDIPDPRHITTLLKWLKTTGLDNPSLGHLKRIRKQRSKTTLLLTISPTPPILPDDLILPDPVQELVPTSAALTLTSLSLKCTFWPTFYAPRRKGESEAWTVGQVRWAREMMKKVAEEGLSAQKKGELPIAACVAVPYEENMLAVAHDTRKSTGHPLRHAVIALIRQMADNEAAESSNYLLTSQTVFITHEPCIMCSMALLHSRVKQVFYLVPMRKTGGCGGLACLPSLPGVNHRFEICSWKEGAGVVVLDDDIDA